MAEVFLGATQGVEGFSRRVAIKRVLPGFSDNEAFARMFVDEAQISSQLVHPNIVSVLDFDRDGEQRLFLVMELVEGKDLDALLATGLLPIPLVIHVIGEVLRGLGYAHDLPVGTHVRGVVHRDVSPHNVLLSWEGAVKVSDFGIAKARAASEATASVFIKGKPAYMSPEQANGQALDGRSDLFAVGIMLWEMLVGRRLFVGGDTRSTLAAVLFGQIPRPRSLRTNVPKDLERVVMKLLERDLPARYASAEEAISDLLECEDAPKAGRELLTTTLAERFAGQAPVRHNRARSLPPAARQTPPHGGPIAAPPGASTLPDGSPSLAPSMAPAVPLPLTMPADSSAGAVPAMPSLGSLRNAPTGTIDYPSAPITEGVRGRGGGGKLALLALGVVIAGFVGFAIVAAVRRPSPAKPGELASGGGAADTVADSGRDAAHTIPPPVDAAAPLDAAAPVDAAIEQAAPVVTAAAPDAGAPPGGRSTSAAAGKPKDRDRGRSRPGERAGTTGATGAPGTSGSAATVAPVDPNQKGTLAIPGLPSLAVLVNGAPKGETPLTVTLPVGTYTITLKSQDADVDYVRTMKVTIRQNETTTVKRPK